MKSKIEFKVPEYVVKIKLHRHQLEIQVNNELEAYELEEILNSAKQIKVRRYKKDGNGENVLSQKGR